MKTIRLEKETKFDGSIYYWAVEFHADHKTSHLIGSAALGMTDETAVIAFDNKCQEIIEPRIEVLKEIEVN
jgi:hypothetical protein